MPPRKKPPLEKTNPISTEEMKEGTMNDKELLAIICAIVSNGPRISTMPPDQQIPAAILIAKEILKESGVHVHHAAAEKAAHAE
jgi:hypothetical protein